jgi:hypothetical protein
MDEVSTIRPGIRLQGHGNGVDVGAVVLANKQADEYTDVVLCYSETSADPYIVWTYTHSNGMCYAGNYFKDITDAALRYREREY